MPVNESACGTTYPSQDGYDVAREVIRAFVDAIDDPNPVYRSASAANTLGHPDVPAPPTFAALPCFRFLQPAFADPELGLDLSRVIHGAQHFAHHRPMYPGMTLRGTVVVDEVGVAGGSEKVVLRTNISTSEGEPVSTATTTFLMPLGDVVAPPARTGAVPQRDPDDCVWPTAGISRCIRIRRLDLIRYAGVSGDCDPVHWSDTAARARGFLGVSAQGMLAMAKLGQALTDLAGDPARISDLGVRFRRRIYVPEGDGGVSLSVSGVVVERGVDGTTAIELQGHVAGEHALSHGKAVLQERRQVAPDLARTGTDGTS